MGTIVFTYDLVGYGQLNEYRWRHNHSETMKLKIRNSIRALDFLFSLGDDPNWIAFTRASGGSTQTFHLTAMDPRISFQFRW